MAQLALNRFQTVTLDITDSDSTPYTAPSGYTAIVKDVTVPPNDAYIPLDGKLVLETSDSIKIVASANSSLKLILSVLETAT